MAGVADALAAVHAAGIVHRDVKPGNILLDRAGAPLLSDFGLARADDGEHLTATGTLLGTPAYMAPEQAALDLGAVGPWSDQYSLAVVLFHMLTGRTPFDGPPLAVLHQIGSKPMPPPSRLRSDLDPALERLLMKALARQSQDRFASIADFAAALRSWKKQPAVATTVAVAPAPTSRLRRLTLLQCGCDLFESQALLEALDPEEQHDLLVAFQTLCREAAAPLAGTVVEATHCGLRICFGIPFALECAARRAVRAGLHVLEGMASLNERLSRQHAGLHLSARLAIHSDRAVVTENNSQGETLSIVGQVMPLVDQLEHLAAPDTVVISEDTHRLLRGFVECTSLGAHNLKGASGARTIYQVHGEAKGFSDCISLIPLIGRDRETALLQDRWEQAVEDAGQVVLLVGEAGIGKSRQVRVLKEHVAGQRTGGRAALIVEWVCSPLTQNSSLFQAIECFAGLLDLAAHQGSSAKLDKLAAHLEELHLASAENVGLLASLLSIPLESHYPPLGMSPLRQKEKTFDLLLDWLRAQADRQPVLFVVEDLHWADPTTLELIELLLGQAQGAGLLSVLTFRPEFAPPWRTRGQHTQVSLNRLNRRHTGELMLMKSGLPTIPERVLAQVAERADGVPLFVEELTAMLLEADALRVVNGRVETTSAFDSQAIPASLQDLLMARLDRLGSNLEVVQLAAAIGREFSYELLSAAASCREETLPQELGKLVDAELLFQYGRPPRARYQFKHALIRDAAYQSLLRKQRQQFHLRIAEALEQRFPDISASQPELLAHHFTEGQDPARAVENWLRAGERAQQRGAYVEAADHFRSGLERITSLPETRERHANEIRLQAGLGAVLQVTKGYGAPAAEVAYARAHALCSQSGGTSQLFPVLAGLFRYSLHQAKLSRAHELAEQMLALAARERCAGFQVGAHRTLGTTLFFLGQQAEARLHLSAVLTVPATVDLGAAVNGYDVSDPRIISHSYLSLALWLLGYPERAEEQSRWASSKAEALEHSVCVTIVLNYACWLHHFFGDQEQAGAAAERVLALSREKGFTTFAAAARIYSGWALAKRGQSATALAMMRQGLVELSALGANMGRSYLLALLAEACLHAGLLEEGQKALTEAQEIADARGEAFWQPEIHRLKGELLLQDDPTAVQDAEASFLQALEVSRRQQARSLELRAAMSLARLWRRQGQPQAARELVAAVYSTFTEGFQTHDLRAARAFLEQDQGG